MRVGNGLDFKNKKFSEGGRMVCTPFFFLIYPSFTVRYSSALCKKGFLFILKAGIGRAGVCDTILTPYGTRAKLPHRIDGK